MGPDPAKSRILVVDADLDMRIYLCNLLNAGGFDVIEAGSREEGLAQARRWHPDLIVLDALLPVGRGLQLFHHLRTDRHLYQVPVVVLSRLDPKTLNHYHVFRKDCGDPHIPGPDAYLNRPPEAETLLETVGRLCPGLDTPVSKGPVK
ncbi:MAG: response regulator [Desulfosarcinaceae bacterium]|nr:response regulator [Desulfosarcinaceae bacterium]